LRHPLDAGRRPLGALSDGACPTRSTVAMTMAMRMPMPVTTAAAMAVTAAMSVTFIVGLLATAAFAAHAEHSEHAGTGLRTGRPGGQYCRTDCHAENRLLESHQNLFE